MMGYKKLTFWGITWLLITLIIMSPAIAGSKTFKLKMADMHTLGTEPADAGEWWANEVEKRTQGRVKIERYWAGSLVKPLEQLDAVKSGIIEITYYMSGYHPDIAPLLVMTLFPFVNTGNLKVNLAAVDELCRENQNLAAEFKKNNVKYLYPFNSTKQYMWSKVPIQSLDDLKGLRLRTMGPFLTLFKELGSGLVNVAMPEIYDTLERGAVSATTVYLADAVTQRFTEVVEFANITNLGDNLGCPVVMNLDFWNSLPTDLQKTINQVNLEMVEKCNEVSTKLFEKSMKVVRDAGITMHTFSPEDVQVLKEISKTKVWGPYLKKSDSKGVAASETFQNYLQLQEKYSKVYKD
jgi:TRAP-type C4-dicarboxylate transport system substrate-binding protein